MCRFGSLLVPTTLCVLLLLGPGCGGEEPTTTRASGSRPEAARSEYPKAPADSGYGDFRQRREIGDSGDRAKNGPRRRTPTKRGPRYRTPGGGSIILPPRPTATPSSPSPGCVVQRRQPVGPPTPGLSAKLVSPRAVVVEYRFAAMPARCKPHWIQLVIAQSRPPALSDYGIYRVTGSVGRQEIAVPAHWRAPPDVVRGSTQTRDGGGGSPTSSILVER